MMISEQLDQIENQKYSHTFFGEYSWIILKYFILGQSLGLTTSLIAWNFSSILSS